MSYRNVCYRKVPSVRVRPVPEMALCYVFTPDEPELFSLNSSAWLILELCEGRSEREIAVSYHAAVEPLLSPTEAYREVRHGLARLVRQGIIQKISSPPSQMIDLAADDKRRPR